ncbi:MAG: TetR/AcrR family transcriptional regulator [Crocinitomicaceae bacterium]|nr:TetR/AcrR family transcriptional regulator [Crocinitomicaceae bacterium]
MGRKSIEKTRKPLSPKMKVWLEMLIPALAGKDLSQLTVDDIATLTKKSKSTIYEYFESKQGIIYTAVEQRITKLDDLPEPSEEESVLLTYNSLIDWLINHLDDISFSFLNQLENNFPHSWELINEFMNRLLETLKNLYAQGIKQGVFRSVSLEVLVDLDEFFITKWLSREDKDQTIDKMILDYVDIRLNGIVQSF